MDLYESNGWLVSLRSVIAGELAALNLRRPTESVG